MPKTPNKSARGRISREIEMGLSLTAMMGLTDGKTERRKKVRQLEEHAMSVLTEDMQEIVLTETRHTPGQASC